MNTDDKVHEEEMNGASGQTENPQTENEGNGVHGQSDKDAEINELNDKYIRLYAEFDNYRRRAAKEKIETILQANKDLLLRLLPVVDDFDRAMGALEKTDDLNALREGVQLIYNKLKNTLQQAGVKEIGSKGEAFDPELHDAITQIPAPTPDLKGKVVDEIEKGYFLNDKIIRHAKVVVGE
jgi:molecular chaperone GrpE